MLEEGDLAMWQEDVQHEVITNIHIDCTFEERWSCILFYTIRRPKYEIRNDDDNYRGVVRKIVLIENLKSSIFLVIISQAQY